MRRLAHGFFSVFLLMMVRSKWKRRERRAYVAVTEGRVDEEVRLIFFEMFV